MIRRRFLAGVVGLKAMCATAALMVGVGQAEAATTVNYDLWLRYEGTSLYDLSYYEIDGSNEYEEANYTADATTPFKPVKFGDLITGAMIRFTATVEYPDPPTSFTETTISPCQLGAEDCTYFNYANMNQDGRIRLYNFFGDYMLSGYPTAGGTLSYWFDSFGTVEDRTTADGVYKYRTRGETANFTVVQPAPVPLPVTAALLPVGLGALAMMRKRRKV